MPFALLGVELIDEIHDAVEPGSFSLRLRRSGASQDDLGSLAEADDMVRQFWLIHGWGPLVLMLVLTVLFGVALENHWGMASLWVLPLWLLTTGRGRSWASLPTRNILTAAAIVQGVMIAAYAAGI